jgi:hypothetical protein
MTSIDNIRVLGVHGKGHEVVFRCAHPCRHSVWRGQKQAAVGGEIEPRRSVGIHSKAMNVIQAIERHGLSCGLSTEQ